MGQPRHPISGTDYPGTFQEFDEWFNSEDACLDYIAKVRFRMVLSVLAVDVKPKIRL